MCIYVEFAREAGDGDVPPSLDPVSASSRPAYRVNSFASTILNISTPVSISISNRLTPVLSKMNSTFSVLVQARRRAFDSMCGMVRTTPRHGLRTRINSRGKCVWQGGTTISASISAGNRRIGERKTAAVECSCFRTSICTSISVTLVDTSASAFWGSA